MKLETTRCLIRTLFPQDMDQLYPILSDPVVMKYIEPPFNRNQTEQFIRSAGLCNPPLVYGVVLKDTNTLIGHIIFHPYDDKGHEIGWIINPEYWGHGIASELTDAMIVYAKSHAIQSLVIECDPRQTVTRHLANKYGFQLEISHNGCIQYRLRI